MTSQPDPKALDKAAYRVLTDTWSECMDAPKGTKVLHFLSEAAHRIAALRVVPPEGADELAALRESLVRAMESDLQISAPYRTIRERAEAEVAAFESAVRASEAGTCQEETQKAALRELTEEAQRLGMYDPPAESRPNE